VPDRAQAADWYARVLGCRPVPGSERWAATRRGLIALAGRADKLALFTGEPQGSRPIAGFHRVAFRLSGEELVAFVARLPELGLGEDGTPARVVDHTAAWSAYFTDPFGPPRRSTYEADVVRQARR
jgi:catechol 2,3-dioxygenase-like lactoylglutathione lyase family enzyme